MIIFEIEIFGIQIDEKNLFFLKLKKIRHFFLRNENLKFPTLFRMSWNTEAMTIHGLQTFSSITILAEAIK